MDVSLTPDQESFIREAIHSGRLRTEQDAVAEAMSLWEDRERRRLEILSVVDRAEASLARGEGRAIHLPIDSARLAEDVKRRGMARLEAEKNLR